MNSHRFKARAGLTLAALVMTVCIATVIAGTFYRGDLRAALPGSIAPDFVLQDENNRTVALSDLRGNVVVVYFSPHADSEALATDSMTMDPMVTDPTREITAGANSDISQLSSLCQQLNGRSKVKVFALSDQPTTDAAPGTQPAALAAATLPGHPSVKMLVDPSGNVAREYRIDRTDSSPTFFVIDGSGCYSLSWAASDKGADIVDKVLPPSDHAVLNVPATQPSSCKQVVQTLLQSQAAIPAIGNSF